MPRTFKKLIVGSLALFIIFGATACAKTPEAVMSKMVSTMSKVKSYYVSAELNAAGNFTQMNFLDPKAKAAKKFDVKLKGDVDMTNPTQMNYALNTTINYGEASDGLSIAGDMLMKDNEFFIKLTTVPATKILDLATLRNNWYRFDLKTLTGPGATAAPPLDAAAIKAGDDLRRLVEATSFFDVTEDLGTGNINGQAVYRYKIKLNQSKTAAFLLKASAIMEKRNLTNIEQVEMNKNLARISEFTGAVSIGQSDYRLYRLELTGQDKQAAGGPATYNLVADFRKFDEVTAIEKPAGAKDMDMMQLFGLSLPSSLGDITASTDLNAIDPKLLEGLSAADKAQLEKLLK